MGVKNRNTKRERPVREKWVRAAVFTVVFTGVVFAVLQYYKFVSKTVYEESVSHLTEVFHQSDNMLREVTNQNLTYLHMWAENLQNLSDEREIRDYIEKAQEDAIFSQLTETTRWSQAKPGILDYRKKWKKRSGREMIL